MQIDLQVLLMAVIIFCGVAGKVLLADYRRLLVTGLGLTQPSFVYAYLALLVQSGANNAIIQDDLKTQKASDSLQVSYN